MNRSRQMARDVSVGIVVTLAAVVFATAIFSIGEESRLWTKKVRYRIQVPNTNGLGEGSPVTLAGVQVGTVTSLELPSDPNRVEIDVEFAVDTKIQSRIRADSTASLKILSLLGGDKFVELTSGSPTQPVLPPGSYIRVPATLGMDQLEKIGATIAEDITNVTGSLSSILAQMQDRETLMGQILFDPNFGQTSMTNISESLDSIKVLLAQMEEGQGLAGRLLSDDEFANRTLARMDSVMTRMDEFVAKLSDDEGAFMRLVSPEGPVTGVMENLDASAKNLARITGEMGEGRGVAGRLLGDDEYADEILENLRQTTRDLRDVVGKLNSGEGTAGALINDPEVYRDLRDVLRGVKESKVISWLIRRYRQKGEEARIKDMEQRRKIIGEREEGDA